MPDPLPTPHLSAVTAGREAVRARFATGLGQAVADELADAAMAPLLAEVQQLRAELADIETHPDLPSVICDAITGMNWDWDDIRAVADITDTVARALQREFGALTQENGPLRAGVERRRAFADYVIRDTHPLSEMHMQALRVTGATETLDILTAIRAEHAAGRAEEHAEPTNPRPCACWPAYEHSEHCPIYPASVNADQED